MPKRLRLTPSRASGARKKRARTVLSEMVTRRARDTAALRASIQTYKQQVAAALGERLAPALRDGETMPDHELHLELASRCVQLAFDRLDELDDHHEIAKAQRAHLARELDRMAKQELYPQAVAVRQQIDAVFGRETGSELHTFTGKTPRTPSWLLKHVERAVFRLGSPSRILAARTSLAGGPVDLEAAGDGQIELWRRRLAEPLRRVAAVDDELSRRTAELDALSGRRKQAMQHFDAVYSESLRLVEAAFVMAGLSEGMIKSLRCNFERRRLVHWARKKRQARDGSPAPAAGASAARPAARRRPAPRALAAVSRWLRRQPLALEFSSLVVGCVVSFDSSFRQPGLPAASVFVPR